MLLVSFLGALHASGPRPQGERSTESPCPYPWYRHYGAGPCLADLARVPLALALVLTCDATPIALREPSEVRACLHHVMPESYALRAARLDPPRGW